MARYAVFLRGVNVGGITIKSAELRRAFESLPVSGVKTLLASGNVVCTSGLTADELKSHSEQLLRERFGYDAWVVVLECRTLEGIVAQCSFPPDDPARHTYLTLFSDPAALDEMLEFARSAGEPVQALDSTALAWQAPKGGTLDSPLNAFSNRARIRSTTTTRNLRTVLKVLAALRE